MPIKLKCLLVLPLLLNISCSNAPYKPKLTNVTESFIFKHKETNNCHAATLVETTPNNLLAAWFGGTHEGASDVGIYVSSYDGNSWSAQRCLIKPHISAEKDTLPCWNPVLFKSKSTNLYLFYKIGKNPREWFGAMVTSTDNGVTWSQPKYLPKGILGPIKNKPIEINPGEILCGSSTESVNKNKWRVHVEHYTEATGKWKKTSIDNKKKFEIIQPTFLKHSNKTIQMLCRSKHNKLVSSWSDDYGYTWKNTDTINVINSNSGIDALTVNENLFLLVNNPLPQGTNWYNGRNVLDVEYSNDGMHWESLLNLENQKEGQFSYPAIIQTSNKKVHILYTYNRDYIKHVSFTLNAKK